LDYEVFVEIKNMKIAKIQIKKFRNLSDIDIEFGQNLNAIAGQNGTSKTALLGLIGHIFTFYGKYKSLLGKQFATQFSEIFKFAYPDYDKAGDHIWVTKFVDGSTKQAMSYDRKETKTLRIRVGESKRGSGKVHLPVIYLGMGRLFPLTLEKRIQSTEPYLTDQEIKEFQDLHNEILLLNEKIIPKTIECSSKHFLAPTTVHYNHLGNSAGQDNLGQIITALISFRRLRNNLEGKYKGGILLIDEVDASLYPASQMKLVEKLNQKAVELNLQIFFTTHSLEVLAQTRKLQDAKIIFLDNTYGSITPIYNLNPVELSQKLLVSGPSALRKTQFRKYVYCEDDEAVDFLKNILPKRVKDHIKILPAKLGGGLLKDVAKKKLPAFNTSIIVLDGDMAAGDLNNVITLPGKRGPDRIAYDILKELSPNDDFWKRIEAYNSQFCFRDLMSLDSVNDKRRVRIKLKKWYRAQRTYWGRLAVDVWKIWIENNKKEKEIFINNFESKLKSI